MEYICLRNDSKNIVYTTFVKNKDLLCELDSLGIIEILKDDMYYTPYDALTKYGDKTNELGKAKNHSIIYDEFNISFFEGRTKGLSESHQKAVDLVIKSLHKLKRGIHFTPGDFISSENNKCIHGKEIHEIQNGEKLKERWLMKTVNLYKKSVPKYEEHFIENTKYTVNG